jgi:hypothetical protein
VYDAEKDLYICPSGETLHRLGRDYTRGYVKYGAEPSSCAGCPLKSRCTNSRTERWLSRGLGEEYLERLRPYRHTEPYRKALRKRAVWVEPLFAEAKEWHGFGRFRLRGLEKVNAEALMSASGRNLKRLVAFGPREVRRRWRWWRPCAHPKSHPYTRSADIARSRRGVFQHAGEFSEVHIRHPA